MVKLTETLDGNRLVFVEFYATWCPHCQRMQPIVERLEKRMTNALHVVTYDIDDPQNEQLVEHYKVQTIPTMLLFRDREQVWRQSGEIEAEHLDEIVRRYR